MKKYYKFDDGVNCYVGYEENGFIYWEDGEHTEFDINVDLEDQLIFTKELSEFQYNQFIGKDS
jgi:hypothetical protein